MDIIRTAALVPREKPERRFLVGWQLKEILDSTMPHNLFEVPKEPSAPVRKAFGTMLVENKISPDFLFGLFQVNRLNPISHFPDRAMIAMTFFTHSESQFAELVAKFRGELIDIQDISSRARVTFNDPLEGGPDYIPITKSSIDLSITEPDLFNLLEHTNRPPLYEKFSFARVFDLAHITVGDHIDSGSVFRIGLKEALNN